MDRLHKLYPRHFLLWILLLSIYIPYSFAQDTTADASEAKGSQAAVVETADTSEIKPTTEAQPLDKRIQNLKKDVSRLNRDLFILEEELLFPASTQVVVFVSIDNGNLFNLDAIELKINDKRIASHLYTDREINSLRKGGIQRLYIGNLPTGKHELVAFFNGQGPNGVEYRRGATLTLEKELATKYVELKIADNPSTQQPEFSTKQW